MKKKNTKSVLAFSISPLVFAAPIFTPFIMLFFGYFDNRGGFDIKELVLTTMAVSIPAFVFYIIPATIVGLIYVLTSRIDYVIQELICSLSGFVICFLWLSPIILGGYKPWPNGVQILLLMGVTGALTSFAVARLLNYLKYKKLKRIKADRKRRR